MNNNGPEKEGICQFSVRCMCKVEIFLKFSTKFQFEFNFKIFKNHVGTCTFKIVCKEMTPLEK